MTITSTAFNNNGHIPKRYSCEGDNINPPLEIEKAPAGTKTLALIVEDPDAPNGTFDHWLLWNIFPNEAIAEGNVPGMSGLNGFGRTGYGGPCPPSGVHRYFFSVYALDTELLIPQGSTKAALQKAMEGHILDTAVLMGQFTKTNNAG